MFSKAPKPIVPPPTPQIDDAVTKRRDENAGLRRRGAAATILTSEGGLPNLGAVARATAGAN